MTLHYHPKGTFKHIGSNVNVPVFCSSSITPDKNVLLRCKEELEECEIGIGSLFFAIQEIYFEHCLIDEYRFTRKFQLLLDEGFSVREDHLLQIKDLLFFAICISDISEVEYNPFISMINRMSSDLEIEFVMNLITLRDTDVFSRFCLMLKNKEEEEDLKS